MGMTLCNHHTGHNESTHRECTDYAVSAAAVDGSIRKATVAVDLTLEASKLKGRAAANM
jgi:hypothetical protein